MAVPNPGTPAGQQPSSSNDPNSNNPAVGAPASNEPLIAGKYKSVEDAIKANEAGYHDMSEKVGRLTQVLEQVLIGTNDQRQPGGYSQVPVGRSGYGPQSYTNGADPYNRNPQQDPDYIDPVAFVTNPQEVLARRDQRMRQDIMNGVANVIQDTFGNMNAVNDFKRDNPELVKHEPLVRAMMDRTNPRDPVAKRLADAAIATRAYLKGLGHDLGSQAPQGTNYVEGPNAGFQQQAPNANQPQQPAGDGTEADLSSYILERNNDYAAKFGIKPPPPDKN